MTVVGNLLLALTALAVLGAGKLQLTAMPGGDRGVGHAWAVLMTAAAVVVLSLALTAILAFSQRLPALPYVGVPRTGTALLFVTVAAIAAAAVLIAAPSGAPRMWTLDMVLRVAPLLVPIGIAVTAAIMLNRPPASGTSSGIVSLSVAMVALCTVGFAVLAALPAFIGKMNTVSAMASRSTGALDDNAQRNLAEVEAADSVTGLMTFVLYARAAQHDTIRERAMQRLQAIPDWEKRLRNELGGEGAAEVFAFLDGNDVPHPDLMAAALSKGIHQQGELVRARIRRANHPSNLYESMLLSDVQSTIRLVRKYEKYGFDFAPAMREYRAAFDERTGYDKPKFLGAEAIDKWLARHK